MKGRRKTSRTGGGSVTYVNEIQTALKFIEKNLCECISLDSVAESVGFSKYHFHRTFQSEVGIPLYDYIRKRRLASASTLLLNTDISILEIAIKHQFESQEAFTRAFKSIYNLPPGRYRKLMKNLITGGFNMSKNAKIEGWIFSGASPQKYQLCLDEKVFNMGTKSACIKSIADDCANGDFATIMQQFNATNFLGKRVKFSAFVKTHDVNDDAWCGLWMRMDDVSGNMIGFDNMQNRTIKGTTEWNHYFNVLDVPDNTTVINIGMLLSGKGQAWLDNVSFQVVDYKTPTTSIHSGFPDFPINLFFEENKE